MKKLLQRYGDFTIAKPHLPLLLAGLITLISIAGIFQLDMNLSWSSLAPKGDEAALAYEDLSEDFTALSPILVTVSAPDYVTEEKVLARMLEDFSNHPDVASIYAGPTPAFLLGKGLLLWPTEELAALSYLAQDPSLGGLLSLSKALEDTLPAKELENLKRGQEKARYQLLREQPDYELALSRLLYGDGLTRSKDQSSFLVTLQPSFEFDDFNRLVPAVNDIEAKLQAIEKGFPGTEIGLTGIHVIGRDEMASVENDSIFSTLLSFIFILLLLILTFRMFTAPVIATIPLVFGIIWDLGLAGFLIGQLNLMTAFVAVMLIGLGIDFAIHFLASVTEYINEGDSAEDSIKRTLYTTTPSILVGGLTTATAFLTLSISQLSMLRELGLIMGMGIIMTLLALLLILPSLLYYLKLKPQRIKKVKTNYQWIAQLANWSKNHSRVTIVLMIFLIIFMGYWASRNTFDLNLLNLEPKGLSSIAVLEEIIDDYGMSPDVLQLQVEDVDRLKELEAQLAAVENVATTQSINDLLPPQEALTDRLALVGNLGPIGSPKAHDDLLASYLGPEESQEITSGMNRVITATLERLTTYQGFGLEDIPSGIKEQFVGGNTYLITVVPDFNIWADLGKEKGKTFLEDLHEISPRVTGTPFFMRSLYDSAKSEVVLFAFVVLGTIYGLICLHFKSLKWSIIAVIPLVVTMILTAGTMTLLGLRWNILNVLALPLIIGIGVDDSLHILHRYLTSDDGLTKTFATVGRAILSTSLTTMIGFGALGFSSYRGIAYFGIILFIGVGYAFLTTTLLLPLFMKKELKPIK